MQKVPLLVSMILAIQSFSPQSVSGNESPALSVAIFDFEAKEKSLTEVGSLARDLLEAELSQDDGFRLVTRSEIEKILEEQEIDERRRCERLADDGRERCAFDAHPERENEDRIENDVEKGAAALDHHRRFHITFAG